MSRTTGRILPQGDADASQRIFTIPDRGKILADHPDNVLTSFQRHVRKQQYFAVKEQHYELEAA
jgi:hypothetical protein